MKTRNPIKQSILVPRGESAVAAVRPASGEGSVYLNLVSSCVTFMQKQATPARVPPEPGRVDTGHQLLVTGV
jgi:hypothetical protein